MDGIHDLGGMHGFGPIRVEQNEPVFHARWEGRVFALAALLTPRRLWTIDAFRHAIETLPPAEYLSASYYERWLRAMEKLLERAGVAQAGQVEARIEASREGRPAAAPPGGASSQALELPSFLRSVDRPPRFREGARVRARNLHPAGHTRLPRYARGHCGVVVRCHPACVFPDTHAHGLGEAPQHVYAVRFEARELWGEQAEPGTCMTVDLFESYLESP